MGCVQRRRAVGARSRCAGVAGAGRRRPPTGPGRGADAGAAATPAAGSPRADRQRSAGDGRRPLGRPPVVAPATEPPGRLGRHRRPVPAAAPRRRGARADVHQARPDPLVRRGGVPRRSWSRSSSAAATRCRRSRWPDVRATIESDLGRPLATVFAEIDEVPLAAASIAQVHAATLRDRRAGGGEGAAPGRRPPRARRPRGDGVARRPARRAHPRRRAGQPAGPRRAVRRHDRRGARLPHRGGQHDRRRQDAARPRPGRLRRPPSTPEPRHPAGAGDAAPRRVQVRRRRRHARRRRRHRGRGAHGDGGVDGGGDDRRDLPRRPPRRQPVRDARRAHRPARLRHRRTPQRRPPAGVPAPDGRRDHQRPRGPDGRAPRPRRAPGRHRPGGGDRRSRPRPARRSTRPRSPATRS